MYSGLASGSSQNSKKFRKKWQGIFEFFAEKRQIFRTVPAKIWCMKQARHYPGKSTEVKSIRFLRKLQNPLKMHAFKKTI